MRQRKIFFFKAWRGRRLQGRAHAARVEASVAWGELYLRFRPLIAAAVGRARLLQGADARHPVDLVNQLVVTLEQQVERDRANRCFADLLWQSLLILARPHEQAIQSLRAKLHLRAVLDQCPDEAAVARLVLLAYLRGELAAAAGQTAAPLSDLEVDELADACRTVGEFLQAWEQDLSGLTASVLQRRAFHGRRPGDVVMNWASGVDA